MARFSDLPVELQTAIWTMVLPPRGGVHWVEFEGLPLAPHLIKETLRWTKELFNDREPNVREYNDAEWSREDYVKFCNFLNHSTPFFKHLYTIVPSVYGKSRVRPDEITQDIQDEIAATRRCRLLSTYSQIATLLSTCLTSRLAVSDYLRNRVSNGELPIYRGAGPMYRPRTIDIWKHQCDDIVMPAPEEVDKLVPRIYGPLDLVVFRLHNASGYPKEVLKHVFYQLLNSAGREASIPAFRRIGIEWHPLWDTPEGREELREKSINDIISLSVGMHDTRAQLYWLVDGIPRPQWDKYPQSIPSAFSRVIEKRKGHLLEHWNTDQARKDQILKYHDLYQEFEAVGRRYYIVFVVAQWKHELHLEESYLDPEVSWTGPFPGGEDLWPEGIRGPVRASFDGYWMWSADYYCSYVLSWEPI